jgi:prefoldin subunit 5
LAALLVEQGKVGRLQRDIAALRTQLGTREAALLPADQLAVLLLYARAFSGEQPIVPVGMDGAPAVGQQPAPPIELQLGADLSAAASADQLIGALDSLVGTLDAVAAGIGEQIAQLEPQLLTLQQQLQSLTGEAERRREDVNLAMEAYTALERQVTAEAITAEDASRGLRLASEASVPEAPVSPQPWLNGALAAVVAFVALVAAVLWRAWRGRRPV